MSVEPVFLLLLLGFLNAATAHNVLDFGAVPSNQTIEASRINGYALFLAMQAAHHSPRNGDRVVIVPTGYEFTMVPYAVLDGLFNVTLQLDGVLNAFQGSIEQWPNASVPSGAQRSIFKSNFIEIRHSSYISLTSASKNGTINGNGYHWWKAFIAGANLRRPNLLVMQSCIHTLLEDWTFFDSPRFHVYWGDALHGLIQRVRVHVDMEGQVQLAAEYGATLGTTTHNAFESGVPPLPLAKKKMVEKCLQHTDEWRWPEFPWNTDGIDVGGRNITIRHCRVQNFDDALCVKPTAGNGNLTQCTRDLLFEDNHITFGQGASVGSVPPHPDVNCIRGITFRRIHFEHPMKAIYVKPNPCPNPEKDGTGIIDDVLYEDITAVTPLWWSIWVSTQQQEQPGGGANTGCSYLYPLKGQPCITQGCVPVTNLKLRNVHMVDALLSPGILRCNSTGPCTGWEWTNVTVQSRGTWPVGSNNFLCHAIERYNFTNVSPGCTNHTVTSSGNDDEN